MFVFFVLANTGVNAMHLQTQSPTQSHKHKIKELTKTTVVKTGKHTDEQVSHQSQLQEVQPLPLTDILQDKAVTITKGERVYPVYVNTFLKKKLTAEKSLDTKPITELFRAEWEACQSRSLSPRVISISFTLDGTEGNWEILCQPSAPVRTLNKISFMFCQFHSIKNSRFVTIHLPTKCTNFS